MPIVITLGVVYIGCCLGLYFFQKRFIFFPPRINSLLHHHWRHCEFFFQKDNTTLQAWKVVNEGCKNNYSMIYFGGNAEEAALNLNSAQSYNVKNVFFINPSGYGKSTGSSSQTALYSDGLAAYDYIISYFHIDAKDMILTGRSLGAAVALYINSQRRARALIAITPFDSIYTVVPLFLRLMFPIKLLLKNVFDNTAHIRLISNPILIIVASNDEVIPQESSRHLLEYSNGNTSVAVIPNTDHQSICANDLTFKTMNDFIGTANN